MSDLALLAVLIGFTARVCRLVQRDHVSEKIRESLYDRWPYDAARGRVSASWEPTLREVVFTPRLSDPVRPSPIGYWTRCPWCVGSWLSAVVVAVVAQIVSIPLPLLWWGAVATGVGVLGGL